MMSTARSPRIRSLFLATALGSAIVCGVPIGREYANVNNAVRDAASAGFNPAVSVLLKLGADVHGDHDVALRSAAINGHTETVNLLLNRGADIHAWGDF